MSIETTCEICGEEFDSRHETCPVCLFSDAIELLRCAADGSFEAVINLGESSPLDTDFPSLVFAVECLEPNDEVASLAFEMIEKVDPKYGDGEPEEMRALYLEAAMRLEEGSS